MDISGRISYLWLDFRGWILFYAVVLLLFGASALLIAKFIRRKNHALVARFGIGMWISAFLVAHVLFGAEIYYRYVFDQTDNVFQIQTTERWAKRHVATNAFGFRDEHFLEKKDPRETRIAVLGDSFTWGYGIKNTADRYSDLLEHQLARRCREPDRIKLFTMGLPGRNTRDELEALRAMEHFQFDGIILGYYMDDASSEQSVRHFQHCYHRVFSYRRNPILSRVIDHSAALQYFWVRFYNRFISPGYAQACWDENYAALYRDPEVWTRHLSMLKELVSYTRDRKIDMAVVIFPFMNLVGPDYPAFEPAQRLTDFFERRGIPVVDLAPLLINYSPSQVMVNSRDFHANELVNRIAADELFKKMSALDSFRCKE